MKIVIFLYENRSFSFYNRELPCDIQNVALSQPFMFFGRNFVIFFDKDFFIFPI